MNRMLRAALELAEHDWPVLPLNGKQPVTSHGHLDATTDPAVIRRMWANHEWNIGSPVSEDLIVLDVDPRNGGSLHALEHMADVTLPPTLEVISGRRDGGRHLYYIRPFVRPYRGNIPHGIDVKTNGYMVMPPSVHPDTGKPYEWVEHEIVRLPRAVEMLLLPRPKKASRRPTSSDAAALATWLRGLRMGERHDGLFWAASRLHDAGADHRGTQLLVDAAEDMGFSSQEAQRVVESASKGAL